MGIVKCSTGKLISDSGQAPLVSEGDFDKCNPVVSSVSPETALGNKFNSSYSSGPRSSLLFACQEDQRVEEAERLTLR